MARKKQVTLVLFPDMYNGTKKLSDAQFGALMRSVFAYRFDGAQGYEGNDPIVDMAFDFMKPQLDRYTEVCEINRINRTKAKEEKEKETKSKEKEGKPTQNQTQNQDQNQDQKNLESKAAKPHTRFLPPTVEQVKQYCSAKGIAIDPERFVNYYTSIGWMVGKSKMKDWQAAIRNWNGKEKQNDKIELRRQWTVGTVV